MKNQSTSNTLPISSEPQRPELRWLADAVTNTRKVSGYLIAADIARKNKTFRSWRLAFTVAGMLVSDSLDGWLARKSGIKSVDGAKNDEQTDKSVYRCIMSGTYMATRDTRYIQYVAATEIRNNVVETERQKLREYGLDASARWPGKAKTLLQSVALVLDASPVGEHCPEFVHGLHKAAVGAAAMSGAAIVLDAQSKLANISPGSTPD